MRQTLMIVLGIMLVFSYAEQALDEQSNQEVIVAPQDPEIQAIVEKMDQAKINGDHVLFRTLLQEYKSLNPSAEVEDGPQVKITQSRPTNNPTPLWTGNDIIIDSAFDYQAFSMDSRSDGYIYLAAATKENSGDDYVINVYFNDVNSYGGTQWYSWLIIYWGGRNLYNPSLKIVETTDSNYLLIAFDTEETTSPFEKDVHIYRLAFGSMPGIFYNISVASGVYEEDPSIDSDDIQYPTGTYLYCAFECGDDSNDSIIFMRSLDLGQTWTSRTRIGPGGAGYTYDDPKIAYGWYDAADSFTVGIVWGLEWDDGGRFIRFRRSNDYGLNWLGTEYFTAPTDHGDWRQSLKMTHGGSPSGVISFAREDTVGTDDEDLCIFYTYDGGRNWINDTLYIPNTEFMLNCLSVDDNLGDYHSFFKGTDGGVRYKEAPYNSLASGGWSGSIAISDGGAPSIITSPASAVYNDEPCVCWKDISATWYKIMFDALWLQTGVEEKPGEEMTLGLVCLAPNPSSGVTRLTYTVEKEGKVTISLYDAIGRLVDNLVNRTKQAGEYSLTLNNKTLAAGVYFIRVETPEGVATKAMTIIK